MTDRSFDVLIVGGGLAGLSLSIFLSKHGFKTALFEKEVYPFHRVCGEYISNETLPFLKTLGFDPFDFGASRIDQLRVSAPSGKSIKAKLDLGGFGLSRWKMDDALAQISRDTGTEIFESTKITEIENGSENVWAKDSRGNVYTGNYLIGTQGKRSNIDKFQDRSFLKKRSPYMGVKYHLGYELPKGQIALHNFRGGYAGISEIEQNKVCFCYLVSREIIKSTGGIPETELSILRSNPFLKEILENSEPLWEKPKVINEISFEIKEKGRENLFYAGDAAGMVAPLFGNGMAMAIRSAKILGEILIKAPKKSSASLLEKEYQRSWNKSFRNRMLLGRMLQAGFGKPGLTEMIIGLNDLLPVLKNALIKSSHGKPF